MYLQRKTMPETIPIRVALRIRPLAPKEVAEGCKECIRCIPGVSQVVIAEEKTFTFDHVLDTFSTQQDLYKTVFPLVEEFFNGYNASVLAYGQTGSGKTFSMGTAFSMCDETDETKGVIPRLSENIFHWIQERKNTTEFLLKASFLEIHNREIQDLLNESKEEKSRITVWDTSDGGIKIEGLKELTVTCAEDLIHCLEQGCASRATGATAMNATSSRSHAIFTITLQQKELQRSEIRKSKFHLVDLAGSERTCAQGERFKEGVNINKGLLALGNVISALSEELRKSKAHIPYRDSKLTRLLQDSLGGNSKTLLLACVSPSSTDVEETINTMRYADRARNVKNRALINLDPGAAELAELRQKVQMLQMQVRGQPVIGTQQGENGHEVSSSVEKMAERIAKLEAENEKLREQNKQMHEKLLVAELARENILRKLKEFKGHFSSKLNVIGECTLEEEFQRNLQEIEDIINSGTTVEKEEPVSVY